MRHSIEVIIDFICDHYGISPNMLSSNCRDLKYRLIRQKAVLLAGKGIDQDIADKLNRTREDVRYLRRTVFGNMRFDRKLKDEYEQLKKELLLFEISD